MLAKDYVLVAIDTGKQQNAAPVIASVRKGRGGGIPWMVIQDDAGKELVTSDGPKGNVGCPFQPHEIAWFRTMLERTRQRLTDAEIDTIITANEEYVRRLKQQQEEAKRKREGDKKKG